MVDKVSSVKSRHLRHLDILRENTRRGHLRHLRHLDILTSYGRQGVQPKSRHLRHLDILRENTSRRHLDILTSWHLTVDKVSSHKLVILDILTSYGKIHVGDISTSWHLDILWSVRCPPTNADILTSCHLDILRSTRCLRTNPGHLDILTSHDMRKSGAEVVRKWPGLSRVGQSGRNLASKTDMTQFLGRGGPFWSECSVTGVSREVSFDGLDFQLIFQLIFQM